MALARAYLRAVLRSAVSLGLLAQDPSARVPRPRQEWQEARDWTLSDMRHFLRAALEDGRPLASMLALMLLAGLRPGEVLGLQWGDVDLEAAVLRVRRAVVWEGNDRWHLHSNAVRGELSAGPADSATLDLPNGVSPWTP